ncbi:hypothetical protein RhiirA4_489816 [Rhizophagus irregularis]|uniref:Uncharacterized protein n=1 Tax=Rhizophagus irregularis TaxID=588596 RepID=A0A2I1HV75_9GLOM|nr:hypothetical protein RhiirA4_489816 [Rhizophagus irregularis]
MIDNTQEDVLEQPRKLVQEKILAKLYVQIDDASNIDEYRKFIKVVQNHILEDVSLKQEDIINLQTQVITQKNDSNNKDKQKENGLSQTPKVVIGIALLATIISRDTLVSLIETPYNCDDKDYFFEEVITAKAKQLQKNENSRDRDKQKENGPSQTPKIIIGIALLATIISRETLVSLIETPYNCDNKDYFFEEVITAKAKQLKKNEKSRDRVVQVFNASLRLTTAIIKPFMRKYGEIEEEECYSRRPYAHAPNRQSRVMDIW